MTSSSRRTPPPTNRARGSRTPGSSPGATFLERNRARLLWGLAAVALVAIASMAFLNATSPAYACSTEWEPAVTPEPAPSATPRLGYVQNDMGREHISLGAFVRYALCPPASGKHYNAQAEGPVPAGVYGPDDQATPQGWIHNLEHGGLVVLYRCASGDSGCSDVGSGGAEGALRDDARTARSATCRPAQTAVIARFDQMKWPYAALLWGQVLPMDAFDAQLIRDFFAQQGERSNPEPLCAKPTATPAPTDRRHPRTATHGTAPDGHARPDRLAGGIASPARARPRPRPQRRPRRPRRADEGGARAPRRVPRRRRAGRRAAHARGPRRPSRGRPRRSRPRPRRGRAAGPARGGPGRGLAHRGRPDRRRGTGGPRPAPGRRVPRQDRLRRAELPRPRRRKAAAWPPDRPLLFAKFANAVIGDGEPIVRPEGTHALDLEVELGVVIGRRARRVDASQRDGPRRRLRRRQRRQRPRLAGHPGGACARASAATASGCGPRARTRSCRSGPVFVTPDD